MGKSIDLGILKKFAKGAALLPFYSIKHLFTGIDYFKEKRNEYLNELKDYYQGKIEEETGIPLGDIKVMGGLESINNIAWDYWSNKIGEIDKKDLSIEKKLKESRGIATAMKISYPLLKLVYHLKNFKANASFQQKRETITYHERYVDRVFNEIFKWDEDPTMIHELSHSLWEKINSSEKNKGEIEKQWYEGFAIYGASNYFNEFLLPPSTPNNPSTKTYKKGYNKVKQIIEKHGEDVYLEIPNKWREFEQEINQT